MKPVLPVILLFPLLALAGPGKKKTAPSPGPISGTILFASTPFSDNAPGTKSSFTSAEYIYGRLEVSGSSIKDAFKLREKKGHYYFVCDVEVLKDGNPVGYHVRTNNYILLGSDNLDKSWVNLDILPQPDQASTLYSMTEEFDVGYGYIPLYSMINPNYFPSAGTYHVNIKIFSRSKDMYDQEEDNEKWPYIQEGFDFTLRESDIAMLKKNGTATENLLVDNAFRYDKMPTVFSNPGKLTDPNATTAKVSAILKRDLPNRAIIKFVAEQYNGAYWSIAKDDFGLPRYKYFNPHIWMAYKANGKCYVGYVTLRQVYSGGGTYGPLQVAWTSTKDDRGIDCAKVK
ncbi:MAG: hypothetical protein ABIT05_02655 [Chitinophagaceae bacterium]